MNVETHMNPTYTLKLTQDELVAIIVAVFTSNKDNINTVYSDTFPSETVDNMNEDIHRLMNSFLHLYQKEKSAGIIKQIRLDGYNFNLKQ